MSGRLQRFTRILLLGSVATAAGTGLTHASPPLMAIAKINDCSDGNISGSARLNERYSREGVKVIDISINVRGLTPGKHAVHIHETGNCTPCSNAKGHFDPGPHGFSSPDGNHPFHSGDLMNLDVNTGGFGALHTVTTRVTLSSGPLSLFDADGSAIIIHTEPDSYCPDGPVKGCAGGDRAACGIIKLR
jgi:Cu-Zn family superoxide dismutase